MPVIQRLVFEFDRVPGEVLHIRGGITYGLSGKIYNVSDGHKTLPAGVGGVVP